MLKGSKGTGLLVRSVIIAQSLRLSFSDGTLLPVFTSIACLIFVILALKDDVPIIIVNSLPA